MPSATRPHVLVVGAGISGLLIAHGLQKEGISFSIFEAEEENQIRTREWTMGVHWSLPLMKQLLPPDLAARIPTDGAVDRSLDYGAPPNNGAYIFDGVSGEKLKDLAVPDRLVRVSRKKLRALFREGIDIHYGCVVDRFERNDRNNTVTVFLTNGTQHTGSLVIGCDGPRSTVRKHLFRSTPAKAEAKAFDGVCNASMLVTYDGAETPKLIRSIHPIWFLVIHPKMMLFVSVQDVPDPDRPELSKFFIFGTWRVDGPSQKSPEDVRQEFLSRAREFAEPFRTVLLKTPEKTNVPHSDISYWVAEPWNTEGGLFTLAGDAAHPMPPFRGQGANQAAQDAYNLVDVIKRIRDSGWDSSVQQKLMDEYTVEVAKRGGDETQLSVKNGRMMLEYDDFMQSPYMQRGLNRG